MTQIEIDGKKLEAAPGTMIIQVADEAGIAIPRFCYHKKLSIAANCRMCLVEVEKAPKPLPACATPITEGMKIFTRSSKALEAQRSVMEFLLINHPLDCPVCDQGGQCELQDLSLGYGKDISRFQEGKRAVHDKNIGPLIETEMTRCIHCTRCVRFGKEVAGLSELGATGRGEHMEIGTYIEKSVVSELSGNVIDLCPVGALTSKPFRFQARAWEIRRGASIAAHDCLGSNLFFHTHRSKVIRSVPRENEAINEVWLSDRDRFSYEGLNCSSRCIEPKIKRNGIWETVDWETALNAVAEKLKEKTELGALISPNATLEEHYLFQKLLRSNGFHNLDHGLRISDPEFYDVMTVPPLLGTTFADLEEKESICFVGANIQKEQPLLIARMRRAIQKGHQIYALNAHRLKGTIPFTDQIVPPQGDLLQGLLNLKLEKPTLFVLGQQALSHPKAHQIILQARKLGEVGFLTEGANGVGAWIAGAFPQQGLTSIQMMQAKLPTWLLVQFEPERDCAFPYQMHNVLKAAQSVIVMTTYETENMRDYASIILPMAPHSETAGTFVNAMGVWQTFREAVPLLEQAKPGWKIFRVLGNLLENDGFEYNSTTEILSEIRTLKVKVQTGKEKAVNLQSTPSLRKGEFVRIAPVALYASDPIVRRAPSLQATEEARETQLLRMHPEAAKEMGIEELGVVTVKNQGNAIKMQVRFDETIPLDAVLIFAGIEAAMHLGASYERIMIEKAL